MPLKIASGQDGNVLVVQLINTGYQKSGTKNVMQCKASRWRHLLILCHTHGESTLKITQKAKFTLICHSWLTWISSVYLYNSASKKQTLAMSN